MSDDSVWLVKDDPDGKWFCDCEVAIVDAPYHDLETYPTGGTGWLWSCAECHRAFKFAKAVTLRVSLYELAEHLTPRVGSVLDTSSGKTIKKVKLASATDWLHAIEPFREVLREGERYVYFDGCALPASHGPVSFKGMWREHSLPDLPHLSDRGEQEVLGNPEYWVPGN